MIENISVFIPAYNQIKSLENSVSILKNVYPDCDIHLCSDNGYDFSDFCQKYNIDYKHYSNRLGYPESEGRNGWTKEKSLEFIFRIKTACEYLKNDFVILFEEDVLVNKKINLDTNFDISGYLVGNIIDQPMLEYIKSNDGNILVNQYGGGGGCIFSRSKYLESFDKAYNLLEKDFDELIKKSHQPGWPDFLICFVFMIGGYQLSKNKEIIELNNNNYDISNIGVSIIHKYKKLYE